MHAPQLCAHLQRLGIQPARLAAPWIAFAFAGYLPPQETLLLWDRVVGFDSLEPLPILAAAIFLFHERALLQAADSDDARHVLLDSAELKVAPLLHPNPTPNLPPTLSLTITRWRRCCKPFSTIRSG